LRRKTVSNMAKILIVEDDRQLSALIVDFLQGEGHAPEAVYKGRDGRERLQSGEYDAVILDWELPDVSGPDICRQHREAGGLTPILMLTGKRDLEDKEAGLDAGADDYLTKPFQLRELSARLRALLRRAAVSARAGRSEPSEASAGPIQAGHVIAGKYRLDKFIAQGGMAHVYQATHLGMGKIVVVKLLQAHLLDDATQRSRFEQEARAMARINHVNVASIYDTGVAVNGQPYLVMEYVSGEALVDRLAREGSVPLEDALEILIQCCRGLEVVHAAGIVHRDLKPDNIMLQEMKSRPDWVKIVDFGISHLLDSKRRLTDADKIIGSAGFIAPEQLRGDQLDSRTDVYALGVIFFLILTNELPFKASNTQAMFLRQLQTDPDPLSDYLPELPSGPLVDRVLQKALAKDPDDRYQTMVELRCDLESLLAETR